jgi:D-glycerate 3-kinase
MMVRFFNKVKSKKFTQIKLPRFDKSVDDRCKRNLWYNIYSRPDVVIFEGWCIGARPQKVFDLKKTVNLIEKTEDKSLRWRKYVNKQLETKYKKLFNKLDGLIYLKVRNFYLLRKWRLKQEKKLWLKTSSKKNIKIMNKKEVINFMSTYQRITQHMFNDMPKISSVIMNLNDRHQINKIQFIN